MPIFKQSSQQQASIWARLTSPPVFSAYFGPILRQLPALVRPYGGPLLPLTLI